MQVNQISQIVQPKVSQASTGANDTTNNKAFELMLQELMQSTENQDSSSMVGLNSSNINSTDLINQLNGVNVGNTINATDKTGTQTKTTGGLDNLTMNGQKMALMLELMQMSSSNNVMANFGSDDGSGDDSDGDGVDSAGSSSLMGGANDVTQLLQTVMQNEEANGSSTGSNDNMNLQLQQIMSNMKL